MIEREYAPVIIPTLNRYQHFVNCLESLERCVGADKTIVYVGLDYPPSQKYVDGWKKINEFLDKKELVNGLKKIVVFRREYNMGIVKYPTNLSALRDDVIKRHDKYIVTEDDNVFHPLFLEFINHGLETYKDDVSVLAVCGYMQPINFNGIDNTTSVVRLEEMSAWGYGTWSVGIDSIHDKFSVLDEMIHNDILLQHFLHRRPEIFVGLLSMKKKKHISGDCFLTAYLHHVQKKDIYPIKSLVKNCGWDGSGTHGGVAKDFLNQELDIYNNIDSWIEASDYETKLIDESIVDFWKKYTSFSHRVLNYIIILIYRYTGQIILFDSVRGLYKKMFR